MKIVPADKAKDGDICRVEDGRVFRVSNKGTCGSCCVYDECSDAGYCICQSTPRNIFPAEEIPTVRITTEAANQLYELAAHMSSLADERGDTSESDRFRELYHEITDALSNSMAHNP